MFSLYFILKFIHVAAIVAWIGAILSLNITAIRATRTSDPAVLKVLLDSITFTGQRVIGPGSGIALLAGIVPRRQFAQNDSAGADKLA